MAQSKNNILIKVFRFYYNGFRDMPLYARKLWVIILIKLFIMFGIFRVFFFHDFLEKNFDSDEQRSEYVIDRLINPK